MEGEEKISGDVVVSSLGSPEHGNSAEDEQVKRALDSVEQCIRSLLLPDSAVATATGKQMTAEYGLAAIAALRLSLLPVQPTALRSWNPRTSHSSSSAFNELTLRT